MSNAADGQGAAKRIRLDDPAPSSSAAASGGSTATATASSTAVAKPADPLADADSGSSSTSSSEDEDEAPPATTKPVGGLPKASALQASAPTTEAPKQLKEEPATQMDTKVDAGLPIDVLTARVTALERTLADSTTATAMAIARANFDQVRVNVGGTIFHTRRGTLLSARKSVLARMCHEQPGPEIFIDRCVIAGMLVVLARSPNAQQVCVHAGHDGPMRFCRWAQLGQDFPLYVSGSLNRRCGWHLLRALWCALVACRSSTYFGIILNWLRDQTAPLKLPFEEPLFVHEIKHYGLATAICGPGTL